MKSFTCAFLLLALFVALSVQTNNRCSRAIALPVPTSGTRCPLLNLNLSLLDIVSLQLGGLGSASSCGAWYYIDNIDALVELNVCALNVAIDVNVFIYEGSCNNLRQIRSQSDCCGIDINVDVELGHRYYVLLVADVQVDCLLDLSIVL